MISIKTIDEIEKMRKAGQINYNCHELLAKSIVQGITTKELETIAVEYIESQGGIPSFQGLNGFPGAICTSINEEVVHGIPGDRELKNGDIISIDIGVMYKGYHSDSARTYPVGEISSDKKELLQRTKEALEEGLKEVRNNIKLDNVSARIGAYAKKYHLGVIEELVGHGIGKDLHEEPDIPNYSVKNNNTVLKSGMTLAIEPMFNLGTKKIWLEDDDWTIVTQDGKPSAHFEHTVLVTDDGYEILTGA